MADTACSIGRVTSSSISSGPTPAVVDADGDARELALRHQVDGQARQRNAAQQHHHETDHEHRHGTMDGKTRNAHSRLRIRSRSISSRFSGQTMIRRPGVCCPGCQLTTGRWTVRWRSAAAWPRRRLARLATGHVRTRAALTRLAGRDGPLPIPGRPAPPRTTAGTVAAAGDEQLIVAAQRAGADRDDGLAFAAGPRGSQPARCLRCPTLTGLERGPAVVARLIDAALALGVDQRDLRNEQARCRDFRSRDSPSRTCPASAGSRGLGISTSIGAVRVAGSRMGETRAMRPLNFSPGKASTSTTAGSPTSTSRKSFSTTLATRRSDEMSTTDTSGAFCETQAPGSTLRLATKPSTGDTTLVLARLILQLLQPRRRLGELCARRDRAGRPRRCSALRRRRASAWAAAGGRRGCASARRW